MVNKTTLQWLKEDLRMEQDKYEAMNELNTDYKEMAEQKGLVRGLAWAVRNLELNQ